MATLLLLGRRAGFVSTLEARTKGSFLLVAYKRSSRGHYRHLYENLVKIIFDFTAVLQFRNPQDVGGAYSMFTLAATPIALASTSPHVTSTGTR